MSRRKTAIRAGALVAGLLLAVIGVRFLVTPQAAQHTFGLGKGEAGLALHAAVGVRDLWLAGLVLAFAWLRNWAALALWFGLGSLVCFADAAIVAGEGARWPYIAFHAGSGVVCGGLALLAVRAGRGPGGQDEP